MPEVNLTWVTPDAERQILFMARVSNPKNQNSENTKLIDFLIRSKHWSPFEMANMCVEIKTSRAISAQILRHRSFSFQEFSQRYAEVVEVEAYQPRRQDIKNRQNSIDDLSDDDRDWFINAQYQNYVDSTALYHEALRRGIAKECARFLLPMSSSTTLYMNGNVRSWIHYLNLRADAATQKEHREIAERIRDIFMREFPIVSAALEW